MTDADLARLDALLAAAREVAGCSDHNCVLRVYPRGGMGTNGGCHCVGRTRTDEGLLVQADRLDLVRLLTLARQTPALVEEVRRLRSIAEGRPAPPADHARGCATWLTGGLSPHNCNCGRRP